MQLYDDVIAFTTRTEYYEGAMVFLSYVFLVLAGGGVVVHYRPLETGPVGKYCI